RDAAEHEPIEEALALREIPKNVEEVLPGEDHPSCEGPPEPLERTNARLSHDARQAGAHEREAEAGDDEIEDVEAVLVAPAKRQEEEVHQVRERPVHVAHV